MDLKKKVGRNELCPCGSGKKFKKCHGGMSQPKILRPRNPLSDPEVKMKLEQMKAEQIQKVKQQGQGREIISNVFKDHRLVAVGNRFYYSKNWRTFHDFLAEYIKFVFGKKWCVSEAKKELSSRHPILQWANLISQHREKVLQDKDGNIVSSPMTGAVFAYLSLSYNLYLLAHNAEVQERLVKHLKNKNLFQGALYETIVASYFIKAGFQIELEDEYDGSVTHCEFVATSKKTGKKYSVEVKTRRPEKADFSIRNQLHKALKKQATGDRIIFIDLNVSQNYDHMEKRLKWLQDVISELRSCEASLTVHKNPAPEAYVFITNHPFLCNLDSYKYALAAVAEGFKITDFKIDSGFHNLREALNSREKHIDMLDLMKAMKEYDEIPSTFDGEIPEYAFEEIKEPRLRVGNKYLINDSSGNKVEAKLLTCCVSEKNKKVHCIHKLENGTTTIGSYDLSDIELQAYKKHPDTFFGVYKKQNNEASDPLEFYDFCYESYKDTAKEKLLEFLKDHQNFEDFKEMPQKELAKVYCEILTYSVMGRPTPPSSASEPQKP